MAVTIGVLVMGGHISLDLRRDCSMGGFKCQVDSSGAIVSVNGVDCPDAEPVRINGSTFQMCGVLVGALRPGAGS